MTAHLLLWGLADSKTTLDELKEHLPDLPEGDHWIWDPATDRFGLVSLSGSLSDIEAIRDLIGKDPEIGEEFEILE